MVSLVEKFGSLIYRTSLYAAVGGGFGYLGGFIYAKLADLPAAETAKAYAVAHAALAVIPSVVKNLTEGMKHAHYINGGVTSLLFATYIFELRRRGLMGDKLLICFTIGLVYNVWSTVFGQDETKRVTDPLLPADQRTP